MDKWERRRRPNRLEKRFEFPTYEATRDFLDLLGEHSELIDRYPDISFGKTYVNITLRPISEDKEAELTDEDHNFAGEIDGLLD